MTGRRPGCVNDRPLAGVYLHTAFTLIMREVRLARA